MVIEKRLVGLAGKMPGGIQSEQDQTNPERAGSSGQGGEQFRDPPPDKECAPSDRFKIALL